MKKILSTVLERTAAGRLEWREAAAVSGYLVSFSHSALILRRGTSGNPSWSLEAINEFGDAVGHLTPHDSESAGKLEKLGEIVERKSQRVDETLDDIFRGLEGGQN